MLNPAFWWLLAVKFLAFLKTTAKKLGDQSSPLHTVVAPMRWVNITIFFSFSPYDCITCNDTKHRLGVKFCPSVRLSVKRVRCDNDNHLLVYQHNTIERCFWFLEAKFNDTEFTGSTRTRVVKRSNPPPVDYRLMLHCYYKKLISRWDIANVNFLYTQYKIQ